MKKDTSFVPNWAKGLVWYQIFPERFRNGDVTNDPKIEDQLNSWPHNQTAPYQTHPWGSDWYARLPYELENGLNLSDTLQRRRYGGDFQGILDKLDYLTDLGIQAVYLNPMFDAPSSHKYDAATWHHADPNFGPDPDGDRELIKQEIPHDPSTWVWTEADKLLLKLIKELHKRGIFIIFDGVFNHMGLNSWVYQDIVKNQRASKYKNWMKVTKWADETEDGSTRIKTWMGFNELPEIKQSRFGIVKEPAEYIHNVTKRWMDPLGNGDTSLGIDGWRLDVAYCIKHPFWKKWRKQVREINPEAFLIAEIIDTPVAQKPYLEGDEFDATMNYNFAFAVSEFFIQNKNGLKPSVFDEKLREVRQAYPAEVSEVMHNLLSSHDTDRVASRIMNAHLFTMRWWNEYYEQSKATTNPKYKSGKPDAEARRTHALMVIFQMTYLGAPVIYYGDEVGMWGSNDPCNRKPMLWDDLPADDESVFPNEPNRVPEKVTPDKELFELHKTLISLRKKYACLQTGSYETILADDTNGVFAFKRGDSQNEVVILCNPGQTEASVQLDLGMSPEVLFSLDAEVLNSGKIEMNSKSALIVKCL